MRLVQLTELYVPKQSNIMKNDGHEATCMLCISSKQGFVPMYWYQTGVGYYLLKKYRCQLEKNGNGASLLYNCLHLSLSLSVVAVVVVVVVAE